MKRSFIAGVIPVLLAALAAAPGLAQQYTALDITPPATDAAASCTSMYDVFQPAGALYFGSDFSDPKAALWQGFTQNAVNLHPSALLDLPDINGFGRSMVTGVSAQTQVGYGAGPNTFQREIALAWNGTADSASVLPIPFAHFDSRALGIGGGQIVGYAYTQQSSGGRGTIHTFAGPPHALLWDEVTRAVTDLHNGAQATVATAAQFGKQVGYGGSFTSDGQLVQPRAMMWQGSPNNFVWLHPPSGYQASEALATDGIQQAGWAQLLGSGGKVTTTPPTHAMVWTNTAASFIDLHPAGFANSYALGVAGGKQVGYAVDAAGVAHAIVWSGSAAGVIDLNQYLPAGVTWAVATGIDATGNISGYAIAGSQRRAILWTPNR